MINPGSACEALSFRFVRAIRSHIYERVKRVLCVASYKHARRVRSILCLCESCACVLCFRLAWRPVELPAADYVDVQMVDGLTAMLACVDHSAKTVVEFFHFRHFANLHKKASKNLGIFYFSYIGNMNFGQNQYMCRALWINISDCDARLIFEYNV